VKLIVLPGMDGTGDMLDAFAAALETTHNVGVVGYPRNQLLSYSELADFVAQRLPQGEPYALVAESFSGPVAALLAARKPKDLRAVVFVASFVRKPVAFPKWLAKQASIAPLGSPWLLRPAKPYTFGRWRTAALDRLLAAVVQSIPASTLAFRIRQVMEVDALATLEGSLVPMLYIRPLQDKVIPIRAAQEMKAVNPAFNIAEVEGPHFVLQVQPEVCASRIRAFLADI
jgi:pimeloyl-[acyl-carrier protein] methyl ester esterase